MTKQQYKKAMALIRIGFAKYNNEPNNRFVIGRLEILQYLGDIALFLTEKDLEILSYLATLWLTRNRKPISELTGAIERNRLSLIIKEKNNWGYCIVTRACTSSYTKVLCEHSQDGVNWVITVVNKNGEVLRESI